MIVPLGVVAVLLLWMYLAPCSFRRASNGVAPLRRDTRDLVSLVLACCLLASLVGAMVVTDV